MTEYCPTCRQLMPRHRLMRSEAPRQPVLESLPMDYDSCQLIRLSESERTIPIQTEESED